MNFQSISTLVALALLCQPLSGQIKEQYIDQADKLTTVVIKEEAASDMDILNNKFDLDEVGMHQVIRITTREEVSVPAPVEVKELPATPLAAPAIPTNEPALIETVTPVTQTVAITEPTVTAPTLVEQPVAEKTTASTTPKVVDKAITTSTVASKSLQSKRTTSRKAKSTANFSFAKKRKYKVKAFNKHLKRQKRKRGSQKKWNRKCYKF